MILAGDIGGTKVNLAFFQVDDGRLVSGIMGTYPSRDHCGLEEIVRNFLAEHQLKVDYACFGLAGPIRGNRAQLTNLSWIVDGEEINRALGFKQTFLLNDLQANAYGIAALAPTDLIELNRGSDVEGGNIAIISAGTGLGEGGLFWDGEHHHALASEGGHSDFSPRTDLDIELLRYLRERFGQVSWEHLLSGPGFLHIYQFLRDTRKGEEPAWLREQFQNEDDPAPAITRAGLEGKCELCAQTVELFAGYYGAEAANLALKVLATGGLYVGGGIAPKIISKLQGGVFMKHFIGQGRMKDLLASVRVRVIMNDKTALIGAARFAAMETGKIG
ncbi:MAG TPA: glucokinase [Verrucomicrobiae bacterium]|jgi:glucokinase|nr:glucokinase [Verrucomicrobiae bacterium]